MKLICAIVLMTVLILAIDATPHLAQSPPTDDGAADNGTSTPSAQNPPAWQLVDLTFAPARVIYPYQVSAGGQYIADNAAILRFRNVQGNETLHVVRTRTRLAPWLHDTMLYQGLAWGDAPDPACFSLGLSTFGVYMATSNTDEVFCIDTPEIDYFQRDPFDDYVALGNDRYLINLRENTWQDLNGALSTQVSVADAANWIAHDHIWWDPQTQLPMARLKEWTTPEIVQTISLCPMESEDCALLVTVGDHVYGTLSDVIISPDGQTILWSANTFPPDEDLHIGAPIGVVEDVVAFATDLQSGATTQIFRLSDHYTSSAKGLHAQWSPDGQTLVIDMETLTMDNPDAGIVLVTFTGPDRTGTEP